RPARPAVRFHGHGLRSGRSADDRLRHQAADGDARDAEDGSEGDRQLRDGPDRSPYLAAHQHAQREVIMKRTLLVTLFLSAALALPSLAAADPDGAPAPATTSGEAPAPAAADEAEALALESWKQGRPITMQYF